MASAAVVTGSSSEGATTTTGGATTVVGVGGGAAVAPSLLDAAHHVLTTADPDQKAELTHAYWAAFEAGTLPIVLSSDASVPEAPARPARPSFVEERHPSKCRSGGKKATIHSLVHAESYAIDLMWDVILRFGRPSTTSGELPFTKDFYKDWAKVANDEAHHYQRWLAQLGVIGGTYGYTPAHAMLWEAAAATSDSLASRLVLVNLVHEARGLDTYSLAKKRFEKSQSTECIATLERNIKDEVTHVAAGVKWFRHLYPEPKTAAAFHSLVKQLYPRPLKPPFNHDLRQAAGMPKEWYMPLVASKPAPAATTATASTVTATTTTSTATATATTSTTTTTPITTTATPTTPITS